MAEARSAVSFRDQVLDGEESSGALKDFVQGLRRSFLRGFFRTRSQE